MFSSTVTESSMWTKAMRARLMCFLVLDLAFAGVAQNITCDRDSRCPIEQPCCSAYGKCGVGAYCLGGCDPLGSFRLESCVPSPVCRSRSSSFDGLGGIVTTLNYLGDASLAEWVSSGTPVRYEDYVLLTLQKDSVGTMLSSTAYVWYGSVSAQFTSSAGVGVVTDFILLSDTKDEIDFEFVGVERESAQAAYYSQGENVTNYANVTYTAMTDVSLNTHNYTVDWSPSRIVWSIDDNVVHTLERSTTWNASANRYMYPQTPARVQLSIWPAGLPDNSQETIDWAGGLIQWEDDPAWSNTGAGSYFYVGLHGIQIECFTPPEDAQIKGSRSYVYTSDTITNETVEITDDDTIIANLSATGGSPDNDTVPASTSGVAAPTLHGPPTEPTGGTSSTGFVQGNGRTSDDTPGLSKGEQIGVGVGVPLGVAAVAIIAFWILWRRRRTKRLSAAQKGNGAPEYHGKPELGAGPIDWAIAGPVQPKSELPNESVKRKPIASELAHSKAIAATSNPYTSSSNELSGDYQPPEFHSSPTNHGPQSRVPQELKSTSIAVASTSALDHDGNLSQQQQPSSVAELHSPRDLTLARPSSAPETLQDGSATAEELAKEADILVQELGLVNMRKKGLASDAAALKIQPETRQGRKGAEWQELIGREQRVRDRLDEIEKERGDLQP